MLVSEVRKLQPLDQFLYWCKERHQIHLRRKAGMEKPWTDDEILRNYFFTNPYRENDKVTVWFRENVREKLRNDFSVMFATICFRWFNLPSTGKVLMGGHETDTLTHANLLVDWDLEETLERLTRIAQSGQKVFTGAFNISNSGSTKPKINRVCEDYIQPAWEWMHQYEQAWDESVTMEGMHSALSLLPGFGGSGFMAYEVVCDLRYTYLLENASDKLNWSNPGPGAKRGINRILGRDLGHSIKDWKVKSRWLLDICHKHLKNMPRFEAREVEHSLCEYDKYARALNADGHMKRRYNGSR